MKKSNCIFCKIIQNIDNLIFENKNIIAILDIYPITKGHILVIPKKHYNNFLESTSKIVGQVNIITHKIAKILIKIIPEIKGFNILTNNGSEAFQEIFHYHVHIIPKYIKEKGFIFNFQKENKYIYNLQKLKIKLRLQFLKKE